MRRGTNIFWVFTWLALAGLIIIMELSFSYLGENSKKWYVTSQDVTLHVFFRKVDSEEKLRIQIEDDEFIVLATPPGSNVSFPLKLKPGKKVFAIKTFRNEIIKIDSLHFNGANDIHYNVIDLRHDGLGIVVDTDLFEFYPI